MMQRDETQLLEPWLRYHGYLFGYENLTVIDHGSREPEVISVLERYRHAGVTVQELGPTPVQFRRKAEHIGRIIRTLDAGADYDFAIPMDCDEFLVLCNKSSLSSSRDVIHTAFDALIGEKRALRLEMSFGNVIRRPGWFCYEDVEKRFLPARSVLHVDLGFHELTSRLAKGTHRTPFCYLHFHHKPFAIFLEHARRKLDGRVNYRNLARLKTYSGDGDHLVKYFFMTEDEYETDTDSALSLSAPEFVSRAAALGIDQILFGCRVSFSRDITEVRIPGRQETPFLAERYLDANPDVRATGIDPLFHYLRHGWREGRPLG